LVTCRFAWRTQEGAGSSPVAPARSSTWILFTVKSPLGLIPFADYLEVDARAAALLPLLNGLNITSNLIQVRKVVAGQQAQHHAQRLRAALIVLAAAVQVRR
jgi:hypothetical protein